MLEWAKEGEGVDVESLRERVGKDFVAGKEAEGDTRAKRRKLDLEIGDERRDEVDGLEG